MGTSTSARNLTLAPTLTLTPNTNPKPRLSEAEAKLSEAVDENTRLKLMLRATEEQLEYTKADLRKANIAADQCLEASSRGTDLSS